MRHIFCLMTFLLLSTHNSFADSKCDFGYKVDGAIAMHGQPDTKTTNQALCDLYQHHTNDTDSILKISEKERFSGLNYLIPKGDVSYSVRPWLVDTLMYRSPFEPFTMYPNIAKISEIPDDRSYVIFETDPKAKFSDQSPITAHDILFSFEKLKSEGLYNYQIAYKNIIAKLISDNQIRFDFKTQNRELPLILGLMPIFSKKTTDTEFSEQDTTPPLMASPYKVAKVDVGKSLTLEKNPDYWGLSTSQGKARFHFQTVQFEFFQNDTANFEYFRAGQSDFLYEDNLKRLHTSYDFPAMQNGDYKYHEVPTGRPAGMRSFVLNTRNPDLSDLNLRRAMFLAFNFDSISEDYLFGKFKQIQSIFANSPLSHQENDYILGGIPNDDRQRLRLAHKILKQNGYYFQKGKLYNKDDKQIKFHLLLNNPQNEKFAGALKKDLEKIGIILTIQTVDNSLYQHYLSNFNYDMIAYDWYNSSSPGIEQKNYWHCDSRNKSGSRNYAGICNENIDDAVNQLVTAITRQDLVKAAAKLDFLLMSNYYFIPLYGQQHYNIIAQKHIQPSVGGATYFYSVQK